MHDINPKSLKNTTYEVRTLPDLYDRLAQLQITLLDQRKYDEKLFAEIQDMQLVAHQMECQVKILTIKNEFLQARIDRTTIMINGKEHPMKQISYIELAKAAQAQGKYNLVKMYLSNRARTLKRTTATVAQR